MNLEIIGSLYGLNTNNDVTKHEDKSNLFSIMQEIMDKNYSRYLSPIYCYDYLKLLNLDLVIIASRSSEFSYGIVPVYTSAQVFDVMCNWLDMPTIIITNSQPNYEIFSTENRKIVKNVKELDKAFKHFNIRKDSNVLLIDADYLKPHAHITKSIVRYLLNKMNR